MEKIYWKVYLKRWWSLKASGLVSEDKVIWKWNSWSEESIKKVDNGAKWFSFVEI